MAVAAVTAPSGKLHQVAVSRFPPALLILIHKYQDRSTTTRNRGGDRSSAHMSPDPDPLKDNRRSADVLPPSVAFPDPDL